VSDLGQFRFFDGIIALSTEADAAAC